MNREDSDLFKSLSSLKLPLLKREKVYVLFEGNGKFVRVYSGVFSSFA